MDPSTSTGATESEGHATLRVLNPSVLPENQQLGGVKPDPIKPSEIAKSLTTIYERLFEALAHRRAGWVDPDELLDGEELLAMLEELDFVGNINGTN